MKNIKVIIATHKKYRMPDDPMYLPVQVGSEGKEDLGYQRDNVGENISTLNPYFCELTGLYWAWKNLDADYVGLAHYRRHFKGQQKAKDPFDEVLTLKETDALFEIIAKKHPDYLAAFDKHMQERSQHAFNMFIMKKDKFDEYCTWMFDIIFDLYDEFKNVDYNAFHARFPGRISERLLDVWLMTKGYSYEEVPFIYMEKINKVAKVSGFLKAKLFHKKYGESF